MSAIPVIEYLAAFFIVGLVIGICGLVVIACSVVGETGKTHDFAMFLWAGIALVFIFGSSLWLWRQYRTPTGW